MQNQAHRGYLIVPMSAGGFSIQKDGFHISYPRTLEDARKTIDELIDPPAVVELETVVMFRRWRGEDRSVTAFFPMIPGTSEYDCMSYAHVGQHSSADLAGCIQRTIPCADDEPDVVALRRELEGRGYRLRIFHRSPRWEQVLQARLKALK